ncbi:MAG: PIG-L family deacetylase [Candidatus Sericytochromatia bacterium]
MVEKMRAMGIVLGSLFSAGLVLGCPLPLRAQPTVETHIYAVAHPDDWQLFMNPAPYRSLMRLHKTVFLILTAGDNGSSVETQGAMPYYLAREAGSLRAMQFIVNSLALAPVALSSGRVMIQGHELQRYQQGLAVMYFLRLPDGNFTGQGYFRNGFEGLTRALDGQNLPLHTVDNSTLYTQTQDLVSTLSELVSREQQGRLAFHLPDPDPVHNPQDHPDHQAVGRIMQHVAQTKPCSSQTLYLDYASNRQPPNVTGPELWIDIGTWAATTTALGENGFPTTWDLVHNSWVGRHYYRDLPSSC